MYATDMLYCIVFHFVASRPTKLGISSKKIATTAHIGFRKFYKFYVSVFCDFINRSTRSTNRICLWMATPNTKSVASSKPARGPTPDPGRVHEVTGWTDEESEEEDPADADIRE
jgi:hypothetical protein